MGSPRFRTFPFLALLLFPALPHAQDEDGEPIRHFPIPMTRHGEFTELQPGRYWNLGEARRIAATVEVFLHRDEPESSPSSSRATPPGTDGDPSPDHPVPRRTYPLNEQGLAELHDFLEGRIGEPGTGNLPVSLSFQVEIGGDIIPLVLTAPLENPLSQWDEIANAAANAESAVHLILAQTKE